MEPYQLLLTYLLTYLPTYLLTYLLTPWSRFLVEKLTGFELVKKFPAFYGTRRFITAFASARHLLLSFFQVIFIDDSRKIRFFAIPYAVPFF